MTNAPTPTQTVRSTLIGAAWLSLLPLLLNVVSVPVTAFIVHRLGPLGYGEWMTAAALVLVCGILTNLGLRGAFIRHVAQRPHEASDAFAEQLGVRIALALAAGAIAVAAAVALGYPASVIACALVGAAGLVLTSVASTCSDLLQAFGRLRTIALVNLAAGLALTAGSLAAAWWSDRPVAVAAAYLVGPAVSASVLATLLARSGHRIAVRLSRAAVRRLLGRCRYFAAQQLLAAGGTHAEAVILPRMVGLADFGLFTAGTILATRLVAVPDGLSTAAYPALAARCASGARHATPSVVRYLLAAALGGAALALLGMAIAAPLGELLFPAGPGFFATVVTITVWSLPLVGVELLLGSAINAAGEDAAQARASVTPALVALAATVTLVLAFGVLGACWAMLLRPAIRIGFLTPLFVRTFWPRIPDAGAERRPAEAAAPMRKAA